VTKDQVVVRFDSEQLTRQYAEQEIKLKQAEGKVKASRTELEVQTNKAASEVAKAKLALTLADLDRDKYLEGVYQVELDDRKGAIALATRDLEEAQEKLENYRKFVKKGFGTPEQLRLKEAEVARAQYNLNRDKAKLQVLEKFTRRRQEAELTAKAEDARRELARTESSSAANIAKAQSELEAAEVTCRLETTQLGRLKKQLDRCIVKAPQDGILVYSKERYWDPNSRIQAGAMVHFQQTLFSLPDLAQMQVKVKIHESMVKKCKPGQKAEVRVDAFPNQVLHGTVQTVATLADAQYWEDRGVKDYITIVKIDDLPSDAGLKPGMTAEVKVLANQLPNVLVVPVQAVGQISGQHCSYVFGPGGVERRDVSVGENNEKFVEVKSGLDEGERVMLDARARATAEAKANERNGTEPPPKPEPAKSVAASNRP
jgi:HlyD family secretion protein